MNQSLCMLLINFSSPRLQDLQRTGMGEPLTFFEQLYHRVIISTMAREEIRVMSTRRGDEVPFLPSSVGEKSWLPLFECLSIDALQIKNNILSWRVFQGCLLEIEKHNIDVQWRKQERDKKAKILKKEFRERCSDVFNRPDEETSWKIFAKNHKIFFVFYKLGELGKQI